MRIIRSYVFAQSACASREETWRTGDSAAFHLDSNGGGPRLRNVSSVGSKKSVFL